jgi:type III secretory pathway component EscS
MFKLDKLLSSIVVASIVGAVVAAVGGMVAKPDAEALNFLLGLVAASGFLIALAIALGVIASISRSDKTED